MYLSPVLYMSKHGIFFFFFIPGDKGEKIGVYSFSAEVRKEDLAELALVTARSMRTEEVL